MYIIEIPLKTPYSYMVFRWHGLKSNINIDLCIQWNILMHVDPGNKPEQHIQHLYSKGWKVPKPIR